MIKKREVRYEREMELHAAVMDSIEVYTGLSPAAFFTIVALMVVVYKMVCGMFVSPGEYNRPVTINIPTKHTTTTTTTISKPVQLGDITEQELRAYDGSDPSKPLLIAIKGQIYDVSSSRMFYGPGGPYSMFAGKEASRALALLSFKPQDITGNLEGLDESELQILQDWEDKFMDKYVKVGIIVTEQPVNGENVQENPEREGNPEL